MAGEHYWMEITDRPDPGADLHAPLVNERGRDNPNYALVQAAEDGDIVFHFHKRNKVILAHSVVRGPAWEDEIVWVARSASARDHNIEPYARPGRRRALQNYTPLVRPVSLDRIKQLESAVFAVRDELQRQHDDPLYFPFAPYKGQSLRPSQGYMVKFPRALVELLGLPTPPPAPEGIPGPPEVGTSPGAAYRRADEEVVVSTADPMPRDPALMERALRSHRATQNALADALEEVGLKPLSPSGPDPDWDIAWRRDGTLYVADIKSLTASNEERQLRLGLGQVLRYQQRVSDSAVVAVLVAERRPADDSWLQLCEQLQIELVWPETWERLLPNN